MFTKNAVSQDVIDAVNSILMQEEKKQMLLEPGKKMELETGFHMAAHAAKKANQSHFEFQGKKYPVTAKSTSESIDEEKDDDSMYTTKAQAKKIADKEAAKEVHKHEKHLHKGAKETKFDEERHMTDDEMAKREKIVKSMKKGMAGFKERYGNRAKNVMYATATKQAMHHEEVQEAAGGVTVKKEYDDKDESEHGVYHGKKKIGYVVHDKKTDTHTAYHGHKYGKDDYENSDDFHSHEKAVNQIKSSAGLKEEVNHLNEEMHFRKTHKMSHVHSPDTISVTHAHHKDHGHIGHIEEYHECDAGGKHTGNKKYAMEHYPSGKQMHGCDTSEEASKHLKKFHEDYCGKMESMGLKMEEKETSTKKVTPKKESIGGIVGAGDGLGNVKEDMKVDTLAGPTNIKNIPKKQAKELSISNGHSSVKKGELINSGDAAPEPRNKPPYKVKAFEAKTPDGQIGDFTPSVDQPLKERVKDMAKRKFRKENMSGLTLSDQ
jgi:hypothetical protein